MKEFVAAGVQIAVKPNDIEYNTEKVISWFEKAVKENGAELVVFPETVTTGFTPGMTPEELYDHLSPIAESISKICDAAGKLKSHIIFPTYERGPERGIVYNSSLLIDDNGKLLGTYRKTHLFPTERIQGGGWSTAGSQAPVYSTKLGKIGMIICYDGDFPELSRVLTIKGAEIITRPSALLRSFEIWDLTNRARAYDNHVYVIAVNAVGPDAGNYYYFGHSMIVDPIARKLAQGRGTEEIIYSKLDPDPIKRVTYGADSPMIFDHIEDRNLSVYGEIMTEARCPFEPAERVPYKKG